MNSIISNEICSIAINYQIPEKPALSPGLKPITLLVALPPNASWILRILGQTWCIGVDDHDIETRGRSRGATRAPLAQRTRTRSEATVLALFNYFLSSR